MVPNPTPIFHITPIDNLRRILEAGALLAKRALEQEDRGYTNIAHRSIQDRRAHTPVPCGPGGVLHDYVPFYFAPRSPMLYTLSRGNVAGFAGGQASIVHLVSTAQAVQAAGLGFVFSDGHGIIAFTSFYDDLSQLDKVDLVRGIGVINLDIQRKTEAVLAEFGLSIPVVTKPVWYY